MDRLSRRLKRTPEDRLRETLLMALTAQILGNLRTSPATGGAGAAQPSLGVQLPWQRPAPSRAAEDLTDLQERLKKLERAEDQRRAEDEKAQRQQGGEVLAAEQPRVADLQQQAAAPDSTQEAAKSSPLPPTRTPPEAESLRQKAALLQLRQEIRTEMAALRRAINSGRDAVKPGRRTSPDWPGSKQPRPAVAEKVPATRDPRVADRIEMEKQILEAEALLQDKLKAKEMNR